LFIVKGDKERTVLRHSISRLLGMAALALLLHAGALQARPDPVTFGIQVEAGNHSQVREWLARGLDPNFIADRIGTGLMIAAWYGDIPMMELFVARGADVNKANELGERAIMHAAWQGRDEAVKWLLARGARVNSGAMQWSALHYAAFAGHAKVASILLERGADINARSTNGSSVLMMAVYEGHEDVVRQLLAKGADTAIRNDRGDGALEWAFKYKRLSIARLVGTRQDFVAAASRPSTQWGPVVRSVPAPAAGPQAAPAGMENPSDPAREKIEELVRLRNTLSSRGMQRAVDKLDSRIAAMRAQRARAERDSLPMKVLEISARRGAPSEQRVRMVFEADGPPP
jgi:ankyrin repeat protein